MRCRRMVYLFFFFDGRLLGLGKRVPGCFFFGGGGERHCKFLDFVREATAKVT